MIDRLKLRDKMSSVRPHNVKQKAAASDTLAVTSNTAAAAAGPTWTQRPSPARGSVQQNRRTHSCSLGKLRKQSALFLSSVNFIDKLQRNSRSAAGLQKQVAALS